MFERFDTEIHPGIEVHWSFCIFSWNYATFGWWIAEKLDWFWSHNHLLLNTQLQTEFGGPQTVFSTVQNCYAQCTFINFRKLWCCEKYFINNLESMTILVCLLGMNYLLKLVTLKHQGKTTTLHCVFRSNSFPTPL